MGWLSKIFRKAKTKPKQEANQLRRHSSAAAISADNPIRRLEDDALGRASIARSFARQIVSLDSSEGVVVGVLGAWGSGKTSFINLSREEFDYIGIPVLDFNPWMFSGAEQLVESFFVELASQLRVRPGLAEVGKGLEDYGEVFSGIAWVPLVGPWIERGRGATKILGKILQRRKEGVGSRRTKLERIAADLEKPIVVVIDDIDRLSTAEIRDVFKLVRLTANFPNIIYIVAFDRERVEDALSEQGIPGRDYLEKILQVAIDLPVVPSQVIHEQVLSAINKALDGIEKTGPFDEQVWPDVFMEIIRPLIRNMRDIRRYAAAIHGNIGSLNGQIALADVLALEAVRVFLPDVFKHLHSAIDALTKSSDFLYRSRDDSAQSKKQLDDLIAAAGKHEAVVRAMIERLFPAGQHHIGGSHYGSNWKGRWLRDRRVAHDDILRLYLERVAGEGLVAFTAAEQAWAYMADRTALDTYLRSLDAARLQDVIASLETYEDKFASEHVVPGTIVLLNLLPDLPERQQGLFEFGSGIVVTRVTYRLLRSLKNPEAVEAAVRMILPELRSLSSKRELISDVGYQEGAGHKLVSEAAAAEFERTWRNEVRSTSTDKLAVEKDVLRVLYEAKREADPAEGPLVIDGSPKMTLALLRGARSEVRSQSMGSRTVRRSPRLAWKVLIELYGNEQTLRARIESLKETNPAGVADLLELADKYLGGWQPDRHDDD